MCTLLPNEFNSQDVSATAVGFGNNVVTAILVRPGSWNRSVRLCKFRLKRGYQNEQSYARTTGSDGGTTAQTY